MTLNFYGPLGYIGSYPLDDPDRREYPLLIYVDRQADLDPCAGPTMRTFIHIEQGRYEEVIGTDAVSILSTSIRPLKVPNSDQ